MTDLTHNFPMSHHPRTQPTSHYQRNREHWVSWPFFYARAMFRSALLLVCTQTFHSHFSLLINNDGLNFVGGGSAGCNTLYQLTKRNVNAVLLERAQMTAGTTWHTAGLVWRLRPNDVEIQLLATTRDLLMSLESETGLNSGWIQNGGLFISHSAQRTNEYRRLQTLGKCFGIESHILSPDETQKVFPLLDPNAFTNSLYSPGDGVVDPAMMVCIFSMPFKWKR